MIIGHNLQRKTLVKLAKSKELSHAYLFFGMPGVGKRTTAVGFAQWLERGEWPVGTPNPQEKATLQDCLFVEPIDGTIGIDRAREIKAFLWKKPFVSIRRTVVIDGAESLTGQAQNALLKLAEEPPASALLVFIAPDREALWPTLISRLQSLYFPPVGEKEISNWLQEQGVAQKKANQLARYSFGRPGLAWRYLNDKRLKKQKKDLEDFLQAKGGALKDIIKEIVDEDDFSLTVFLDALALRLANRDIKDANIWHVVLGLRQDAERYNLNPRIQLTALHQEIVK